MKHVIYLDIDGVLAPFGRENARELDRATCVRLAAVIRQSGATVVLCSSWPEHAARPILASHGIEIAEVLPDARRTQYGRLREIRKHIRKNHVRSWVWIDDDPLPKNRDGSAYVLDPRRIATARHIHTSWHCRYRLNGLVGEGFSERNAERVLHIFEWDERAATFAVQLLEHTMTKHAALDHSAMLAAHLRDLAGFIEYLGRIGVPTREHASLIAERSAQTYRRLSRRRACLGQDTARLARVRAVYGLSRA